MGRGRSGLGANNAQASQQTSAQASTQGNAQKVASTLLSVENRIADDKVESAIAVDESGNILFDTSDGAASQVSFGPKEQRMAYGKILTHNHPKGYYLSVEDVSTAVTLNLRQVRATTPDGRTFVLERKSDSAQGAALQKAYYTELHATASQATAQGVANAPMSALGNMQKLNHYVALEHTKIINKWLADNAPKYGYEFREETRK